MRGFPIRTSSDHSSFANSPRLIAGYNVLLRLLMPRHPPSALKHLTTKSQRCSRPLCSSQTTNPTNHPNQHPRPTPQNEEPTKHRVSQNGQGQKTPPNNLGVLLQDPTVCPQHRSSHLLDLHREDQNMTHQVSTQTLMFHPKAEDSASTPTIKMMMFDSTTTPPSHPHPPTLE